ncbi:MAG: hypothetical protein GY934_24675 [Gammaproteobacteria bacterium]|nr:hypothetical protein [Gammaproteobacteria bacterium]
MTGKNDDGVKGRTPEEQQIFQKFYQRRVDESGAGGSDKDELRVAREVLEATTADGLTPTADGGVSYVRRKGADWSDPDVMNAARSEIEGSEGSGGSVKSGGGGNREMLQGVLIMVAVLLGGGYWFFFSGDSPEEAVAVDVTEEATEEATRARFSGEATPTPLATLEAELLADIVDSSGVKTGLVVPRTMEIKGVSFVVQPVQITSGDWELPLEERAVSWVYGTVINYVIGIEATAANKSLLASLTAGDEFLVRMSTGDVYRFAYADAVRVSPQASEIFRQNRPGVTLVLLGDTESDSRVVIRANYLPESDFGFTEQLPEVQAELGERVALNGSIYVTAIEAELLFEADPPPGYVWQAVQYQVENLGEVEVSTDAFKNNIEAEGISYPVVAVPHALNPTPAIPPVLAPGQVFSTTAIYAIPETALTQSKLAWEFVPGPAGLKARVLLPVYPGLAEPAVQLLAAALVEGKLQLSVEVATGLRSVEMNVADFVLTGGQIDQQDGNGNLFPWQVQPGETSTFALYLHPDEVSGIMQIVILKHGFEIEY